MSQFDEYARQYEMVREQVKELDVSIRRLSDKRDKLRSERDRLQHLVNRKDRVGKRRGKMDDRYGVAAIDLVPILIQAQEIYYDNHLAARAGVSAKAIKNIRDRKVKFVTLVIADSILTALNKHDLLDSGAIKIVPNPYMTRLHAEECGT